MGFYDLFMAFMAFYRNTWCRDYSHKVAWKWDFGCKTFGLLVIWKLFK